MEAKLVVVGGEAKPAEIRLKLPTTIGRGKEATLTLPHPLVSRLHTEIFESDGKLFVRDLGSLNGTFVNKERIEGDRQLQPGELLTIGTVTFRAIYECAEGEVPAIVEPDPQAPVEVAPMAETVMADDPPTAQPIAEPVPEFTEVEPVEPAPTPVAAPVEPNSIEYADLGTPDSEAAPSPDFADDSPDEGDEEALNAFLNGLD